MVLHKAVTDNDGNVTLKEPSQLLEDNRDEFDENVYNDYNIPNLTPDGTPKFKD